MKKAYYLSTCDTCKRIFKEINLPEDFETQDLKTEPINQVELEILRRLAGSYESLFNKRAQLYRKKDLKNQVLEEEDYKKLILDHYTFLKRPIVVLDQEIFIGNAKKNVAELKEALLTL